jgi:hypothetical protein
VYQILSQSQRTHMKLKLQIWVVLALIISGLLMAIAVGAQETNSSELLAVDNGQVLWTIERVEKLSKAGNWKPLSGMTYLVVIGIFDNHTQQDAQLYASDIRVNIDGEEYRPHNGLMDRVGEDLNMDFVGAYSGLEVKPGKSDQFFVAFEVPERWDSLSITFNDIPARPIGTPPPTLTTSSTFTATTTLTSSNTSTPESTRTPRPTNTMRPTAVSGQATTEGVNSRSCPSVSCDVVRVVSSRDVFKIFGAYDDWYGVEFEDGERAYIRGDFITLPEAAIIPVGPRLTSTPRPTNTPRSATNSSDGTSDAEIFIAIRAAARENGFPILAISRQGNAIVVEVADEASSDEETVDRHRMEYTAFLAGGIVGVYDNTTAQAPITISLMFKQNETTTFVANFNYKDASDFIYRRITLDEFIRSLRMSVP